MVKWVAKNNEVLEQAIDETSTTKKAQLGTVVRCWDSSSDALGEANFIYATGVASTVLGDLCEIINAGASSVRAVASGNYRQLGVAMSANVASQYGWYQISGKAKILALASFLADADCYLTSTAGSIDDAEVSGDYIYGMVGITAVDTPATGFAYVQLASGTFTTDGEQILDKDNTFTGANTFEGTTSFDGNVTVETGNTLEVADDSGLSINSTAVSSTAAELNILDGATLTVAELNRLDDSNETETITVAGAISVTKTNTNMDSTAGTFAATLAACPATMIGKIKTIRFSVDNGDVTLALTNVQGGTAATTATFADATDELILIGSAGGKWTVVKEFGVTLS